MLACANRHLGDVYAHSEPEDAILYYQQAQKLFFQSGNEFGADEVEELIRNLEI